MGVWTRRMSYARPGGGGKDRRSESAAPGLPRRAERLLRDSLAARRRRRDFASRELARGRTEIVGAALDDELRASACAARSRRGGRRRQDFHDLRPRRKGVPEAVSRPELGDGAFHLGMVALLRWP